MAPGRELAVGEDRPGRVPHGRPLRIAGRGPGACSITLPGQAKGSGCRGSGSAAAAADVTRLYAETGSPGAADACSKRPRSCSSISAARSPVKRSAFQTRSRRASPSLRGVEGEVEAGGQLGSGENLDGEIRQLGRGAREAQQLKRTENSGARPPSRAGRASLSRRWKIGPRGVQGGFAHPVQEILKRGLSRKVHAEREHVQEDAQEKAPSPPGSARPRASRSPGLLAREPGEEHGEGREERAM